MKPKSGNIIQVRFPKVITALSVVLMLCYAVLCLQHPIARFFALYKIGQYVFVNFPTLSCLEWCARSRSCCVQ